MKNITKIVFVNFAVLAALLITPPTGFALYNLITSALDRSSGKSSDPRADYPTYKDKDYANTVFQEFSKLPSTYRSFTGWRRNPVSYQYTTIKGPYNTRLSSGERLNNSVWFFGGSTIWGTGASDQNTIPSYFHKLTGLNVYNFGESGWTSRQSLNELINLLNDGHLPSSIVFYDGVNDVLSQCRTEFDKVPSHSREKTINSALKRSPLASLTPLRRFFTAPYTMLAKKTIRSSSLVSKITPYDCHRNHKKALKIAQHLVKNWHHAYIIARNKDINFRAVLQPHVFTSGTIPDYFTSLSKESQIAKGLQLQTIYPLVAKEIRKSCDYDAQYCNSIINGSTWLHKINNVYIDFCHLNPVGNKRIASRMKDHFNF